MIIIAFQRGGAAKLAAHLVNDRNNDHVEFHEVNGFMAESCPMLCRKYMLNPWEHAAISIFLINRIQKKSV